MDNPCKKSKCGHLCLLSPTAAKGFICKCRPGFRLVETSGECVEKDNPYLMVIKGKQIVDVALSPEDKRSGYLTPIVDLKYGTSIDYDTTTHTVYWTEMEKEDDVNGTLFMSHIGGGDKVNLFEEFDSGMIGSAYAIAFDWVGRNMYIANQESSTIELVRVDGKQKQRMVLMSNNGNETGVAKPVAIALDPNMGKMYWLDQGGVGVPAKLGSANMDGSDAKILVQTDITFPESLAVDDDSNKIYFSSSGNQKVIFLFYTYL